MPFDPFSQSPALGQRVPAVQPRPCHQFQAWPRPERPGRDPVQQWTQCG